jgi:hypothetical protein
MEMAAPDFLSGLQGAARPPAGGNAQKLIYY